jgi:hypothetical protein
VTKLPRASISLVAPGTAVVNIALYFLSGSLAFAANRSGAKESGPIVPLEWIVKLLVYFRRLSVQADGLIKVL